MKEPLSAKFLLENQQSFNGSTAFKTPQDLGKNIILKQPSSSFKVLPTERTVLNMQQIKASNQLNINCQTTLIRSPSPFKQSQNVSPATEVLRAKMQPTDSSENKNLAQGIKINVC